MKRYLKYFLIAPPLLLCAAAVCLSHESGNAKQDIPGEINHFGVDLIGEQCFQLLQRLIVGTIIHKYKFQCVRGSGKGLSDCIVEERDIGLLVIAGNHQ